MKRLIIATFITITAYSGFGQSNLSFFHMQNSIPQVSNYNASYFPNSKVYVSLPALSGIDFTVNNAFGINDIFTETGDSTLVDINRFLGSRKKSTFLNVGLGITDLMVGVRLGDHSHFSFFINERMNATFNYPIDLMNFLWQGNRAYIGENFVADDFSYKMTMYREWGVGYARKFLIANRQTNIGVRLKYLTGLFHSSAKDLALSIHTSEEDYSITTSFNEARILSAGISQFDSDEDVNPMYFIHNGNQGFGVDIGAQMQFNRKLRLGAAINDLGFISWKDNAEEINLSESSFRFEGINLDNTDELGQAIQDSLDNIEIDSIPTRFNTSLNARAYFSADYEVTNGGYAQATVSNYFTQGAIRTAIGLGYLQNVGKWFSASTTFSMVPQQGVDIGMGLMFKLSVVQLYVVADNLLNTINIPNAKAVNLKFGLNFLIGKYSPPVKKPRISIPVEETEPSVEKEEQPKQSAEEEEVDEFSDYSHLWDE